MRLINTKTFLQCEFTDNIPKYAILSHTWGEEEVTYQDYAHQKESSQRLLGFKKIEYLAEQAKAVGRSSHRSQFATGVVTGGTSGTEGVPDLSKGHQLDSLDSTCDTA